MNTDDPQVIDGTILIGQDRIEPTHVVTILTFAELAEERERTAAAFRFVLLYMLTVLTIGLMFALPAIYAVLS